MISRPIGHDQLLRTYSQAHIYQRKRTSFSPSHKYRSVDSTNQTVVIFVYFDNRK